MTDLTLLRKVPVIVQGMNKEGTVVTEIHEEYTEFTDNYLEDLVLLVKTGDMSVTRVLIYIALGDDGEQQALPSSSSDRRSR